MQTIDEAKTHHRCGGRTACVGTHAAKMAAFPVSGGRDGARPSRCGGLWRLGGTPRPTVRNAAAVAQKRNPVFVPLNVGKDGVGRYTYELVVGSWHRDGEQLS